MIGFAEFVAAASDGRLTPYPWQERFAARCVEGGPPRLVGVPTGCGKTTVVDALVWALATQADRPAADRTVGVRVVWAIDRRILVDEVHEHVSALATRLSDAQQDGGDPLHEMATALAALSGDVPLVATRWRGGLDLDRKPVALTQPEVITSTVAQIGSRLLFRGYGVGSGSLAMTAGLAACDTTICLDEAHLAAPFRQTVQAIGALRDEHRDRGVPGLKLISLTATPDGDVDDTIELDDADWAVKELERRLRAVKRVELRPTPDSERERTKLIAERVAHYLETGAMTVACVLNNVRRARDLFDHLNKQLACDVALLVGPQRPADRQGELAQHGPVLFGDATPERPLVCVATQTFEVGLDADVEAMVTDSASATALIQRLGRLNRRGSTSGRATVVRDEESWLYAADEPAAWAWLEARRAVSGEIDMSVAALVGDTSRPAEVARSSAPLLTPEIADLLVQTNPRLGEWQEPSINGFLRGVEEQASDDVAVCWRCDMRPTDPSKAASEHREALLGLVPPQAEEKLTLSIRAARALLSASQLKAARPPKAASVALSDADIEGGVERATVPDAKATGLEVPFNVLRGGELLKGTFKDRKHVGEREICPQMLRPGDTIILDARSGGVDEHGLAPTAPGDPKLDVAADRPSGVQSERGHPVRISRDALTLDVGVSWKDVRARCIDTAAAPTRSAVRELVHDLAEQLPEHAGLEALRNAAESDGVDIELRELAAPDPETGIPRPSNVLPEDGEPTESDIERNWVLLPVRRRDRSHRDALTPPPSLDAHARAVRQRVEETTVRLGLLEGLASTLAWAAAGHDHGKADARMQAFFYGGVRPIGSDVIAKSVFGTSDPTTARRARVVAGYPSRWRHESSSVAAIEEWLRSHGPPAGVDADLLLHLIGVHHGRSRPMPPVTEGGETATEFHADVADISATALGDDGAGWDQGEWLERFWRVVARYGAWDLAYLEALLMSADRSVSAEGR